MSLLWRPWSHCFDFAGRSRRLEYLVFIVEFYAMLIGLVLAGPVLAGAMGFAVTPHPAPGELGYPMVALLPMMLFLLVGMVAATALSVRRLHDLGVSGLWLLVCLTPLFGQVLAFLLGFVLILIPAPRGENQYGLDPRDPVEEDDGAMLNEVFS